MTPFSQRIVITPIWLWRRSKTVVDMLIWLKERVKLVDWLSKKWQIAPFMTSNFKMKPYNGFHQCSTKPLTIAIYNWTHMAQWHSLKSLTLNSEIRLSCCLFCSASCGMTVQRRRMKKMESRSIKIGTLSGTMYRPSECSAAQQLEWSFPNATQSRERRTSMHTNLEQLFLWFCLSSYQFTCILFADII